MFYDPSKHKGQLECRLCVEPVISTEVELDFSSLQTKGSPLPRELMIKGCEDREGQK